MATDYRETRQWAGTRDELFGAASETVGRIGWKVKSADVGTGVIVARTSWLTMRGGGETMVVTVRDGAVTCESQSWTKFQLSDMGKNRANVERFFGLLADPDAAGSSLGGLLDRARDAFERPSPTSAWAPPDPATRGRRANTAVAGSSGTRSEIVDATPDGVEGVEVRRLELADPVMETVATDEFPVDNTAGQKELTVETEVRFTLRGGLSFADERTVGGQLGVTALSVITGHIKAEASRVNTATEEREITKSYKATFTAGPGEHLVYRVTWKRRAFPGEIEFVDGDSSHVLPFELVEDLEYSVSSTRPGAIES